MELLLEDGFVINFLPLELPDAQYHPVHDGRTLVAALDEMGGPFFILCQILLDRTVEGQRHLAPLLFIVHYEHTVGVKGQPVGVFMLIVLL